MLKWFYKWLDNKLSDSRYIDDEAIPSHPHAISGRNRISKTATVRESGELSSEAIQFRMFKASGGWAIEFRQYDNRTDRYDTNLYVVNDEEELGKHISQIITMEALKR